MFGGLGGLGDIGNLMKMAKDLQGNMKNIKEELESSEFNGQSGNGLVKVVVSGTMEVKSVNISSGAVDSEDPTLLEDLVKSAFNNALVECKKNLQSKLGAMTGGMVDLPNLF